MWNRNIYIEGAWNIICIMVTLKSENFPEVCHETFAASKEESFIGWNERNQLDI